jgi:hypothetical protein
MKRWILTLAATVVGISLASGSMAAPPTGKTTAKPGQKAGARKRQPGGMKRLETALAKLNLSADQKTKVDKLIADAKADGKKLRTAQGTPEEKRAKRRASSKAFRQKLNAILTPAQRTQIRASMPKRPAGAKRPKVAGTKPAKT